MEEEMASIGEMIEFIGIIRNSGASFCQVIRIKQLVHDIPCMMAGNQKWRGAAPIFNPSANISRILMALSIV
jgi:hypothetical protein